MLYYDRIDASKGIDVLMLIRQVDQKSVIFVTNCFFLIIVLSVNQMTAIDVMIYL